MNNNQRDELEELKLADQTDRILETGQAETPEDSRTHELGRLLKQSASHNLPESNAALREQLLAELEGDAVPLAPTKMVMEKPTDRVSYKRMWMGLAAGALVAVGGWWLYQPRFGS